MSSLRTAKRLAGDYIESLENRFNGVRHYVPSGFATLDKNLPAWLHQGHLIVVAGRPAMGKSAFVQQVTENVAAQGQTTLFFTLEMSGYELTERSISRRSGVPIPTLKTAEQLTNTDWTAITHAVSQFEPLPLLVDDGTFNILPIVEKSRNVAANTETNKMPPLGLIVVDYIQLVNGKAKAQNREAEVASVSKALKLLAKELHVPVIGISQLNRGVEGRVDKRPTMADLRESGAIEQDADLILFLYRDDYYNAQSIDAGLAEVIAAKNRHGSTTTTKLRFLGERVAFEDIV